MILHLKVVEAVDVPKMDVFSKSDPYCIISLSNNPNRQRTQTIKNTDHPVWNKELHFQIQNKKNPKDINLASINLVINLFDEDTFSKDDLISSIEIPLNDYVVGKVYDEWYSLFPAKKIKEGGRLHLIVHLAPKDAKPFVSTAINSMNPMMNPNTNYNYNYNYCAPSQLPQLKNPQMYGQRQSMNQYSQATIPAQQSNPYLQQQQMRQMQQQQQMRQIQMQQMQMQQMQMQQMQQMQMQQMQQMQMQQMQRMQAIPSNPYMAPQVVYTPIPGYNYANANNNMMYGAVPPPTQNVYPTVTPSQLPRISNQPNAF